MADADPTTSPRRKPRGIRKPGPVWTRFWSKLQWREDRTICWLWQGARDGGGYGLIRVNRMLDKAHRLAWEWRHGRAPGRNHVLHRCDNPPCANPYHLMLGNAQTNCDDKMAKGRARHVIGVDHPAAKLNPDKVRTIRDMIAQGISDQEIANEYGVSSNAIRLIRIGRNWSHLK